MKNLYKSSELSGGEILLNRIIIKLKGNKEINNASWMIFGKIIQMILAFFVSIITARFLGPSNYGIINYASAYVAFFTSLCTLGLDSIIVKDLIQKPEEQGTAIGTSIFLRGISSSISIILVVLIVSVVDYGESETIIVTALCAVALIFQSVDIISYWFQAKYESKITTLATLVAYCISSLYKIVLLILKKNIRWFAFASSIDFICSAIMLLVAYKKHDGPKLRISLKKGNALLSQSYHYILSGMMVAIYGQTDKIMLKQMLNEKSVGYYSLAFSVNSMWVFVLAAIIASLTPTIITLHNEGKTELFERKNRQLYALVIYISMFVALFFVFFGKFAITIVYGKAYAPAGTTLKIISWYTIFSYLGVARNPWIVCTNNQKYLKYMYLSAAIINILLNALLIPLFGTSGAAFASLITQICTSLILPAVIKDMRPNTKLMIEAFFLKKIK